MDCGMISVDKWSSGSQIYFLTHLHADQTAGLSCTWRRGLLFCSRLTAKLFPFKFPNFDLSLLRILDIGTWHSLCLTAPISGNATRVMARPLTLSIAPVVDIITSNPKHDIVIAVDSLGKEDLLLYIARALDVMIWVWPERLQVMHLLGFPEIFTTKTALTGVCAVPCHSFSVETLEMLNELCPTIGIMPSGLSWVPESVQEDRNVLSLSLKKKGCSVKTGDLGRNSGSATRYNDYIYVVPYSDHSCFSEIKEFIELLRPVNIKGIASSSSCYIEPRYYFNHLCGTEQAMWRIQQQKLENGESTDKIEEDEIKSISEVTSAVLGKKRKTDGVDVRTNRVNSMRRFSRGVKLQILMKNSTLGSTFELY